jgi:hypothetical protein
MPLIGLHAGAMSIASLSVAGRLIGRSYQRRDQGQGRPSSKGSILGNSNTSNVPLTW